MSTEQFSIFDQPPISRPKDPETSQQAALKHTYSGRRTSDKQLMLDLVNSFPGRTAAEYSDLLRTRRGINWYRAARMTTKRLSDIQDKIRIGEPRQCSVTGDKARTYWPKKVTS
ncbi:MAG: hypothetical protein AAF385_11510 [Pseudomonadota bacterium]